MAVPVSIFSSVGEVNASAQSVWDVTVDVERLPELTPTMTSVVLVDPDVPLAVGSQARIRQPGMRELTWTVSTFDEPNEFVWSTKVMGVTMVATHLVERLSDETCRQTLTVALSSGWRARLMGAVAGRKLQAALETESSGIAAAAERR